MSLSTPLKKQFPLKLLGIDNIICSNEEVLEFLELYVPPSSISYLHFDSYQKFYVVFLNDIDSVCTFVGKRLSYSQCKIDILPLLDYYLVRNVYPDLTNEDLIDIFRPFGNVYDVKAHHVLPNSSKFSHVLSGNREISFMLPGHEIGVSVPGSVVYMPHTFHVIKYCPACSTEGHAMLHCPDIEDSCLPQETSVELRSDIELEDFNVKGMLSDDDKFLLASELDTKHDESSEQSNVRGNSLEKADNMETIICETLENSQETKEVYKEKKKYKKKHWIDARWTISAKTRKRSETVVYCVKRKYKKRKDHEKHNRMHANSEQNEKKARGKRKWRKAFYARKNNYKLKQTMKHSSKKETKNFFKKAPLKVGRPRKNPEALDKPPSQQKVIEKICLGNETQRKDEVSIQTPLLPEEITRKTCLGKGRPRKNPEVLDLTSSLQHVTEKSADEEEICLNSFSLHASLEKKVRNSEGILPVFVLKRLLLMDLRNKKDIISYISKFTLHFDQVFHQLKKLQSQIIESEDFHLSKNDHYQTKLFCLMKTLLREKSRHRAFILS